MISRRSFLHLSALGLAAGSFLGCSGLPLGRKKSKGKYILPSFNSSKLRIFDADTKELREVALSHTATHSALKHPQRNECLVFDNMGPGCSRIDLNSGKVIREAAKSERLFYGHGAYAPDGKTFLCTEYLPDSESYLTGTLAIRDAVSLEKMGEWSTHGVNPHDICFLNSDTIAITNHGNPEAKAISNVAFLSYSTGNLIRKVEKESDGHFGHLVRVSHREAFVAGVKGFVPDSPEARKWKNISKVKRSVEADRKLRSLTTYDPSPFYFVAVDGGIRSKWLVGSESSFRNNFSLSRSPTDSSLFATASGAGDSVVIWKDQEVIKVFQFPGMYPSAVAFSADGSELVVGSANGQVRFIDVKSWQENFALQWDSGPVHILTIG